MKEKQGERGRVTSSRRGMKPFSMYGLWIAMKSSKWRDSNSERVRLYLKLESMASSGCMMNRRLFVPSFKTHTHNITKLEQMNEE
jgi:hypothetical protein